MRAVIQRITSAAVAVDGLTVSSAGAGLLVLVGFHVDDTDADMDYILQKIVGLRIFADDAGVMNRSVEETGGDLLIVSQFTLYGDARKGRRPSWSSAMEPGRAKIVYERFLEKCRERYPKVAAGIFGADMQVSLVNDGPVTILLDSYRGF